MAKIAHRTWRNDPQSGGMVSAFRSGLEKTNAQWLTAHRSQHLFEQVKIKYVVPAVERTYTPDFLLLANGIIVETKGEFDPTDRAKHLLIRNIHPHLDIRFVFQRPNSPLRKGSPTTYAMWADKHGFKWATKVVPQSWMEEPRRDGLPTGPCVIEVPPEAAELILGKGVTSVRSRTK